MENPIVCDIPLSIPIGPLTFDEETLLISGCSGFLGKVILEKLLRTFSCKKIYVLLREKRQKDAISRLKSELVISPIFSRLRDAKGPSFDEWFLSRVVPISADLLVPGMGLSMSDRVRLAAEVTVIIHAAASVEFDLPIKEAMGVNTDGSLEMLSLAKECLGLKAHVHVSTCYVNSHIRGFVKEAIYAAPFNVQEMYRTLQSSTCEELADRKQELIQGWPNTYTFTKFLTEHLLVQNKGQVPLIICRPSIIAASAEEPVPGWTDSISAASAVFMAVGMGICPVLPGSIWNVADVVPVDICANMILLAAGSGVIYGSNLSRACAVCHCGSRRCDSIYCSVPVVHCGTSSSGNPMTWFAAVDTLGEYYSKHPPARQLFKSRIALVPNQTWFDVLYYMQMKIPGNVLSFLDRLAGGPFRQMNKAVRAGERIVKVFSHFTENEWIFDSDFSTRIKIDANSDLLNIQLRSDFDWNQYIHLVCYGMRRFCLRKESAQFPENISIAGDALQRSKIWKSEAKHPYPWHPGRDLHWVCRGAEMKYSVPSHKELVEAVLSEIEDQDRHQIKCFLRCMATRFDRTSTRFFGYCLHKLFSSMFSRISVNEKGISNLSYTSECPILLVPTHRSYLDFLLVSYVLFAYSKKLPFIAAGEDFQKIPGVNSLLRNSGAFFIRRKINDPLYATALKKYFQQVLLKHGMVEFFIEGTRSRSGHTLRHKNGLLSYALDLIVERKVKDIKIVPVSISYERVLEAESFLPEQLGQRKSKESLSRILKAVSVLNTHYGKTNIFFGDPISAKSFLSGDPVAACNRLGETVTGELDKNLVVMISHLVAAAILSLPRSSLTIDSITECVNSLRDWFNEGNFAIDLPPIGSCEEPVRKCLSTHFFKVVSVKNNQVVITTANGNASILMLAYYRNHLLGLIGIDAALLACYRSLSPGSDRAVLESDLVKECFFLIPLLGLAVIVSKDRVGDAINRMVMSDLLVREEDSKLRINPEKKVICTALASAIHPFIDCAWLTAVGIRWRRPLDCDSTQSLGLCILELGQTMLQDHTISNPESISLETIRNTIQSFIRLGIIERNTQLKSTNLDRIITHLAKIRTDGNAANLKESINVFDFSKIPTPSARL